ncbi:DUF881 domain-containing protein [Frankia sp. AiPs1]|uniref:DUF881 domain-containing protein n=1 Tax=Frankia sp. AiPa1 TaxID=573492 RepID=UPI00202B51AB|nr:DUF881 domain-containing protein [Frankia sp. AiPa1]MCL9761553.1 DUF881 domain-containing protein [Frankia sp. AiPa1]
MALAVALILLAGVVTLGVRQAATEAAARGRLAGVLRTQVDARSAELALTGRRVGELRRQVAASRAERRRAVERQTRAAGDIAMLGPAGGFAAVRGPGLRITVTDRTAVGVPGGAGATEGGAGPDAQARSTAGPSSTADGAGGDGGVGVGDHDLADLVNVLWLAGAEAVAVNGVRLTALSAIRAAADVILVGLVPVLAPYVIEAVGEPAGLASRVERSAVVDRLRHRASPPTSSLTVAPATVLTLPAAQLPVLRNARRSG